jgi:hypothetical protein
MKYIKNIVLSSLIILGVSSCNDDDTEYTFSTKSRVTIDNVSASSITEGESVTVTLTVDTPYKETLDFKLEMISGGDNADYNVGDPTDPDAATTPDDGFGNQGYLIQIPAYASSYEFTINSVLDLDVEGTENYQFRLTNTRNGLGLISGSNLISFSAANYEDNNVGMILSWSKDQTYQYLKLNHEDDDAAYPDDDEELSDHADLCGVVDYDVFLDSFDAYAFTGDCPEYVITGGSNPTAELADGTYAVVVDLWDFDLGFASDESLIGSFALPFEIVIAKTGLFRTSITYPDLYYSYSPVSAASGGSGEKLVATIEVVGGLYTVYDREGGLVAQE